MQTQRHEKKPMIEGDTVGIGIVVSDYYPDISKRLLSGALKVLKSSSRINTEVIRVEGAWEIPVVVGAMMQSNRFSGMVALGCVIRGETAHFDYLCDQCARALMDLSLKFMIPVGFGILTVESEDQAWERTKQTRNKGAEAAVAVVRAIDAIAQASHDKRS